MTDYYLKDTSWFQRCSNVKNKVRFINNDIWSASWRCFPSQYKEKNIFHERLQHIPFCQCTIADLTSSFLVMIYLFSILLCYKNAAVCIFVYIQSSLPCLGESVREIPESAIVILWIIQMTVHKDFTNLQQCLSVLVDPSSSNIWC